MSINGQGPPLLSKNSENKGDPIEPDLDQTLCSLICNVIVSNGLEKVAQLILQMIK